MHIALWVTQALLALVFGMAGFIKTFQPAKARATFDWAKEAPASVILFAGITQSGSRLCHPRNKWRIWHARRSRCELCADDADVYWRDFAHDGIRTQTQKTAPSIDESILGAVNLVREERIELST